MQIRPPKMPGGGVAMNGFNMNFNKIPNSVLPFYLHATTITRPQSQ